MSALTRFLITACLCLGAIVLHAEEVKYREVRGRLQGLDGKPAAGRRIILLGLSRGTVNARDEDGENPFYNFTTGADGRFMARFADLSIQDKSGEKRPRYGTYALYAEPGPDDAGAVFAYIQHLEPQDHWWRPADEWGVSLLLPPDGLDITLQIVEGFKLKATVFDYEDPTKPVAGVSIGIYHNLHHESHSGRGGEIFYQRAKSDERGQLAFKHVYPQDTYIAIGAMGQEGDDAHYWLRTEVDGEWRDSVPLTMATRGSRGSQSLEVQVATRPLFRYFGKVTNPDGSPAAGIEVSYCLFHHNGGASDDMDWHNRRSVHAGSDGAYEIWAGTPWVNWIDAGEPRPAGAILVGDPILPPGEYNIQMKEAAKP